MREFLARNSERLILLLVAGAIALGGYSLAQQRAAINEACTIQQRGLAAGHYLTDFFVTWDKLIGLTETPRQRQKIAREPRQQRLLTYEAIADLNAYAAITSRQPKHRTCP